MIGPPMEEGVSSDQFGGFAQIEASLGEAVGERMNIGEAAVGDGLVGERPEAFGGVQLRRVGRQKEKDEPLGRFDFLADVPAGVIEDEDDDLGATNAAFLGEGLERFLEGRDVDGVEEIPDHLARAWFDKAIEIEPLVAVVGAGDRSLAPRRPDAAGERLQAEAVLVEGPDFEPGPRIGRPGLVHCILKFFLNPACCPGLAARS